MTMTTILINDDTIAPIYTKVKIGDYVETETLDENGMKVKVNGIVTDILGEKK
jgi:hypothetical protein